MLSLVARDGITMHRRRALWNLLRVEWENIKQNRGKEAADSDEGDVELDPFLAPSSMTMSPLRSMQPKDIKYES